MNKNKPIEKIEYKVYSCAYDDLSSYGRAIRDFCNYLNNSENITQKDIIKQIITQKDIIKQIITQKDIIK